jgi:hypothetical protein
MAFASTFNLDDAFSNEPALFKGANLKKDWPVRKGVLDKFFNATGFSNLLPLTACRDFTPEAPVRDDDPYWTLWREVEGLLVVWHKVQQRACCVAATPFTLRNIIMPAATALPPASREKNLPKTPAAPNSS